MVGVPGKYKGCNTCRLRRVKCDNQRPFCKKCIDGGRECAGYERETVFIVGTIEDQGRCSSHPPRVVKPKKSKAAPKGDEERLELVPTEPLRSAWDDRVSVSWRGKSYRLQVAALQIKLQTVTKGIADDDGNDASRPVFISLPPYESPDIQPAASDDDFRLASQSFLHLGTSDEAQTGGSQSATDSMCLFLYEHNNSSHFSNQPPWRDPSVQHNTVRRMGPESFRSFPNHHFFVRIYRPNAICAALLNRTPTFLAAPEWPSTPFELHPKSALDRLLDILAFLPSLLARADRILAQEPTVSCRLMAQDLINNCLDIELDLSTWYSSLDLSSNSISTHQPEPPFWLPTTAPGSSSQPSSSSTRFSPPPYQPPFSHTSPATALALTYYHTTLLLFYPTLWRLYWAAVFDPVLDVSAAHHEPMPLPVPVPMPVRLQALDPMPYSPDRVRQIAGDVCRHMGVVLEGQGPGGVLQQPDLLAWPLEVVRGFYQEQEELVQGGGEFMMDGGSSDAMGAGMGVGVGMGYGGEVAGMRFEGGVGVGGIGGIGGMAGEDDGRIGVMWCEGFRERLVARGREIQEIVQGRGWASLADF